MFNQFAPENLVAVYRDGLLNDTLPFWINHSVDREFGGFMTSLNRDGAVIDTDKGVWQQARFTWLLGELFNNVDQRSEWLDLAIHGANFLEKNCFDPDDGRMWFHVTCEGRPIRKRRYSYGEAFAAIAFGELAQATGDQKYAARAKMAFDQFVDHSASENAAPKFTDQRPTRALGIPMITIVTAQQLRDSIKLPRANELIDNSIESIRKFHCKPEMQCVLETVGLDGRFIDHFDGRLLNPGHAIEAAWFIMNEGKYRSDNSLLELGCQMLDWMWERGWDDEQGGIKYFVDAKNLPVQEYWHDMKFWWPHNEAIIATLLAFQLTGNEKYKRWHQLVHDWSYKHFPDPQHGEWFGYLYRDGRISNDAKGNLWKGPFHLPRMQLTCWQIAAELNSDSQS